MNPFLPPDEIRPNFPNSPVTFEIAEALSNRLQTTAKRRAELSDRVAKAAERRHHGTLYGIAAALGVACDRTEAAHDAAWRLASALIALESAERATTPGTFPVVSAAIDAGRVAAADVELIARAEALDDLDEEIFTTPGERVIAHGVPLAVATEFARDIHAELTTLSVLKSLPAEWRQVRPNVPEMSAILDNLAVAEKWLQHADGIASALAAAVQAFGRGRV